MSRPLNFQQIQAFKAVMETGTTTKAALALNTTQPSISRRLAELRAATGLELFDLYNGRLRPTREGSQLYQAVRKHFDALRKSNPQCRSCAARAPRAAHRQYSHAGGGHAA